MVGEITQEVLEGAWKDHTDWRFYPMPPEESAASQGIAAKAQALIRIVHEEIKDHLRSREGRMPHYEDYFAALKQIAQDATGEIVAPLISGSVANIRRASTYLHNDFESHIDFGINSKRFASLCDRSTDLIQCVVRELLNRCGPPEQMDLLTEAAQRIPHVPVFSLNHDRLIEDLLSDNEIPFSDGFSEPNGDATFFDWSWNKTDKGLRLYKLHGSVDWYLVRYGDPQVDRFARLKGDVSHAKLESGEWIDILDSNPSFLTGTTVKEQAYGYGLYGELFEEFRHRLKENKILVCSGYGWADKGINIRLSQWLRDRQENKVIILHDGNGESLKQVPFWRHRWNEYQDAGKLIHIPKWLTDTKLDEILACC